jgi:hypothetical protein
VDVELHDLLSFSGAGVCDWDGEGDVGGGCEGGGGDGGSAV